MHREQTMLGALSLLYTVGTDDPQIGQVHESADSPRGRAVPSDPGS